MPDLIKVDSGETDVKVLLPIAEVLLQGGVVAGPTQTFYGLMAAADELTTLNRILEMKGRDGNKPLLLLLDCPDRARCYAKEIPEEAKGLINTFWPGPLSLLLRARPGLPGPVVGPTRTVGVRVEGLPVIRRLVRMIDRAVTGTSANPGGFPPARTAGEVEAYFGDRIDLIIDSGPCPGGLPSTLIDVSLGPPRLIRDGGLSLNKMMAVAPKLRT